MMAWPAGPDAPPDRSTGPHGSQTPGVPGSSVPRVQIADLGERVVRVVPALVMGEAEPGAARTVTGARAGSSSTCRPGTAPIAAAALSRGTRPQMITARLPSSACCLAYACGCRAAPEPSVVAGPASTWLRTAGPAARRAGEMAGPMRGPRTCRAIRRREYPQGSGPAGPAGSRCRTPLIPDRSWTCGRRHWPVITLSGRYPPGPLS